jgi:ABC-type Fe3+/spermidine/putrescine transport system ATPase subunit
MYGAPKTLFCAHFFGETNIVRGKVTRNGGGDVFIDTEWGPFLAHNPRAKAGDQVHLSLRPEAMRIGEPSGLVEHANAVNGTVDDVEFICSRIVYRIKEKSGALIKCQEPRTPAGIRFRSGSQVALTWDSGAPVILFE